MERNLPPRLLPNLSATKPGASLPWDAGGGAPAFTGFGVVVDEIGDSRTNGLNSSRGDGYRYFLKQSAPLLTAVGANTDAYGAKHDGTNGATAADLVAVCTASAALTPAPTHAIYWAGVNDFAAVAASRTNILAGIAELMGGANTPKVAFIREVSRFWSTTATLRYYGAWYRGLAQYAVNRLVDVQVGLGLGARFQTIDPVWVHAADLDTDNTHYNDTGSAKVAVAVRRALRSWQGSSAVTPRSTAQADLIAAMGADLLHAFDGRDQPTESGEHLTAWPAFVGGTTLDGNDTANDPRWTGGAAQFSGAVVQHLTPSGSGDIVPASSTIVVASQNTDPGVWNGAGSASLATLRFVGSSSLIWVASASDKTLVIVITPARLSVAAWDVADSGAAPMVRTVTYDGVGQMSASSYSLRVNGVDQGAPTMSEAVADYTADYFPRVGLTQYGGSSLYALTGTVDALLVANGGLSTTKRVALEAFATAATL